jgi:hypothetical protein
MKFVVSNQGYGSVMFIPDPGSGFSHPGSGFFYPGSGSAVSSVLPSCQNRGKVKFTFPPLGAILQINEERYRGTVIFERN